MNIIDIGANLTNSKFKNRDELIHQCKQDGIGLILTGTSDKINQQSVDLANKHNIYTTVGIHPHNANTFTQSTIPILKTLALGNKSVIAIGETGLDYNRMLSTKEEQIRSFKAHIELAIELKLPLFLHEREAHEDFVNVLDSYASKHQLPKIVIHCFTGTEEEAKKYITRGAYLGFTGYLCMNNRGYDLRQWFHKIPDNRIMIETDCPYMNPLEDGTTCIPQYVEHTLNKISELKKKDMRDQILNNTKLFFNIE